ncbi:MAG: Sua5/YciO/YrdC/YwlC family protein, partial [Planctomycetota bacterium]|nr:Sua5/YciO/YrdC/YwlC family protein [Planctomycetota bacterium]
CNDQQREALLEEAVGVLARGEACVLPTETVYGFAMRTDVPAAVTRVRELKGRAEDHGFTWHLAKAADAARYANVDDPRLQRLFARYCPGPLTIIAPSADDPAKTVGLRVPAHDFTRQVIDRVGQALWLTSVNKSGDAPLIDPSQIQDRFGDELALLIDDGPSPVGMASTIVRCTGPELEILREGILSRADILSAAATNILFLCTGNTCRSPLAEVLAQHRLADRLGIDPQTLLARGLLFQSSGIAAANGAPASEGSLMCAAELGLDLSRHQSRPLTARLLAQADHIYCLSNSHRLALLDLTPEVAEKTELLSTDGHDIADPYGQSLEVYREAREQIAAAIDARIDEWAKLVPETHRQA